MELSHHSREIPILLKTPKEMKKLILFALLASTAFVGFSQEGPVGRMIPGQRGMVFKKHNIEFRGFYGKWTAPDIVEAIGKGIFEGANIGNTLGSFDVTGGGVYGGSILLLPDNRISLGADLLVNTNTTNVSYSGPGTSMKQFNMKYTSLMARMDFHYINFHHFKLYGSTAVGKSWESASNGGTEAKKSGFAYQITPIGVAFGGMIVGWAELGFGYRGILSTGFAVRL